MCVKLWPVEGFCDPRLTAWRRRNVAGKTLFCLGAAIVALSVGHQVVSGAISPTCSNPTGDAFWVPVSTNGQYQVATNAEDWVQEIRERPAEDNTEGVVSNPSAPIPTGLQMTPATATFRGRESSTTRSGSAPRQYWYRNLFAVTRASDSWVCWDSLFAGPNVIKKSVRRGFATRQVECL
ncbi:MAG: hypothetical protein MK102_07775 [Fuerstiella sp.]|nr:hypothetical protein [Fuerstiella sp.]